MERDEPAGSSRFTAPHPYDSANWLSRVTPQWMNTVLKLGSRKPLGKEDIFPVREEDSMDQLVLKLEIKWQREVYISRAQGCKPHMWRALSRMFSWRAYMTLFILKVLRLLASVFLPLLLWFFLSYLEQEQQGYSVSTILFVGGIIVVVVTKGLTKNHYTGMTKIWGIRLKVACIGLIYKKVSATDLKQRIVK